jgi:hypothetical protein
MGRQPSRNLLLRRDPESFRMGRNAGRGSAGSRGGGYKWSVDGVRRMSNIAFFDICTHVKAPFENCDRGGGWEEAGGLLASDSRCHHMCWRVWPPSVHPFRMDHLLQRHRQGARRCTPGCVRKAYFKLGTRLWRSKAGAPFQTGAFPAATAVAARLCER